ncbi:hypothetical protein TWF730_010957 [Orbilia blumenaviensis]|uniref:Uncharacterized protein n=1 Tax=Orbilia blumenaviensis TaxID=1796055 RepID=A0AAV9UJB2_9PEZI
MHLEGNSRLGDRRKENALKGAKGKLKDRGRLESISEWLNPSPLGAGQPERASNDDYNPFCILEDSYDSNFDTEHDILLALDDDKDSFDLDESRVLEEPHLRAPQPSDGFQSQNTFTKQNNPTIGALAMTHTPALDRSLGYPRPTRVHRERYFSSADSDKNTKKAWQKSRIAGSRSESIATKPQAVCSPDQSSSHAKASPDCARSSESKPDAFIFPARFRRLSGLTWSRLGYDHAFWWRRSEKSSLIDCMKSQEAVTFFYEIKQADPPKFTQLIKAIEGRNTPPIHFRLSQPATPRHANDCLTEEDDDPIFSAERASKLNIILILLELVSWRDAACRLGHESSISSTLAEAEGSLETSTSFYEHDAVFHSGDNHGRGNASSNTKNTTKKNTGAITPGGENTNIGKTSLSGNQKSRQDSEKRQRYRGGSSEDDDSEPPQKRQRKHSKKSLSGKFACPFARAEPTLYLRCLTIGRKDVVGIKEHLRRNHYNKTTPPALLAAKTWSQMFAFCYPLWVGPYPSPYLDAIELFYNCLRWNNTPPNAQQGDILLDYQRIERLGGTSIVNAPGIIEVIPNIERVDDRYPEPARAISNTALGSSQGVNSTDLEIQLDPIDFFEIGYLAGAPSPAQTSNVNEPSILNFSSSIDSLNHQQPLHSFDIFYSNTPAPTQHGSVSQALSTDRWSTNTGISPALGTAVSRMAAPHITAPITHSTAVEDTEFPNFLMELGIDTSLPPEERFQQALSLLDSSGIFDPATDFTMPSIYPVPASRSLDLYPREGVEVREAVTHFPVHPMPVFPEEPTACDNGSGSENSSDTACELPQPQKPAQSQSSRQSEGKYLLLVSRRPVNPDSTEAKGYKRYNFGEFDEFRNNFEGWLVSNFTDPVFDWTTMEFYNDHLGARLGSIEEVIDDLEGSFTHYRSQKASLYLVMKDKGKNRAKA